MSVVSIIVPIYKVEKYLRQCLDSIINQSYKELEIILVDDGSPDNCGEICDEYAKNDSRIKVIHKENGGLSSARNAGLDVATGEYISFIDSDDFVANNFIEHLYSMCINNNADIAECDFQKFTNEIDTYLPTEVVELHNNIDMSFRLYQGYISRTIVVWNKLYKRHIYKDLRFPMGKINEDEFTTYKALYKCDTMIATTNLQLYYYRNTSDSIMGKKFNEKRLDFLEALKERKEFYVENNEKELYNNAVRAYQKYLKDYYILTKINVENSKKYLCQIKRNCRINIKDYIKIKDIPKREKFKMCFFCLLPDVYYYIIRLL